MQQHSLRLSLSQQALQLRLFTRPDEVRRAARDLGPGGGGSLPQFCLSRSYLRRMGLPAFGGSGRVRRQRQLTHRQLGRVHEAHRLGPRGDHTGGPVVAGAGVPGVDLRQGMFDLLGQHPALLLDPDLEGGAAQVFQAAQGQAAQGREPAREFGLVHLLFVLGDPLVDVSLHAFQRQQLTAGRKDVQSRRPDPGQFDPQIGARLGRVPQQIGQPFPVLWQPLSCQISEQRHRFGREGHGLTVLGDVGVAEQVNSEQRKPPAGQRTETDIVSSYTMPDDTNVTRTAPGEVARPVWSIRSGGAVWKSQGNAAHPGTPTAVPVIQGDENGRWPAS